MFNERPEQCPSRPNCGDDRDRNGSGLHGQPRRRRRPAHDSRQGPSITAPAKNSDGPGRMTLRVPLMRVRSQTR
jgi:hypothetical protein